VARLNSPDRWDVAWQHPADMRVRYSPRWPADRAAAWRVPGHSHPDRQAPGSGIVAAWRVPGHSHPDRQAPGSGMVAAWRVPGHSHPDRQAPGSGMVAAWRVPGHSHPDRQAHIHAARTDLPDRHPGAAHPDKHPEPPDRHRAHSDKRPAPVANGPSPVPGLPRSGRVAESSRNRQLQAAAPPRSCKA